MLLKKIKKHFPGKAPKFLIALSGGPDSVYLTEQFLQQFPKENILLAHFHHNLRENSINDQIFCSNYAKKKGINFFTETWKNPVDSEEKARNARLQFLKKIQQQENANVVCFGTHFDDLAETIFFRFLRGSGITGLSGIQEFDPERKFFRPLLHLKKEEILESLHKKNILYQIDETNLTDQYDRNFLRNIVFPQLKKRFPKFSENIVRQSEIFQMTGEFLKEELENRYLKLVTGEEGVSSRIEKKEKFFGTDVETPKFGVFEKPKNKKKYQKSENVGAITNLPNEKNKNVEMSICGVSKAEEVKTPYMGVSETKILKQEFFSLPQILQYETLRKIFSPRVFDFDQTKEIVEFIKVGKSGKKKQWKGLSLSVYSEYFFVEKK